MLPAGDNAAGAAGLAGAAASGSGGGGPERLQAAAGRPGGGHRPPGKENALPQDAPGGDRRHRRQDVGFIRGYLNRIAQLEKEIRRLKEVRSYRTSACCCATAY